MLPDTSPQEDYQLTVEELAKFKRTVLIENLRHLFPLVMLIMVLMILIIFLERQTAGQFDEITWIRVASIAVSVFYLMIIGKPGQKSYKYQRSLFLGASSISLLFSAIITGQVSTTQGGTFIYIINTLLLSTFLVFPLIEILGVVSPSAIYLIFVIFRLAGEGLMVTLIYNIVNIVSVMALAIMISQLAYRARKQRFVYEIMIQKHNEFLKTIANLDGLTGVANRRQVDETIKTVQAYAARDQISVAVLMCDLDNFKAYNDFRGHLAGDELLKSVAEAMKGVLQRESDFFGRYGGEEFIAILPFTDTPGAEFIAEKMRQAVFNLGVPHPENPLGMVTVSIGVAAAIPTQQVDIQQIIHLADQALYRAKRLGKNRVEV